MTSEATVGQVEDVYGQVHPVESPDLISRKRKEFDLELEKIPANEKANLSRAQGQCPDLLTNEFILIFLRSEVFNADVSSFENDENTYRGDHKYSKTPCWFMRI